MTTLTVYDPAMCCTTGICGAEVNQELVTFAADLDWLKSRGIAVTRINLSHEPAAFAANTTVSAVLQETGVDGLPVILMDGRMQSSGRYPTRDALANMVGVKLVSDDAQTDEAPARTNCGCTGGATDKSASGCC